MWLRFPRFITLAKWGGLGTGAALLLLVLAVVGGLVYLAASHSRNQPLDLMPYVPKIKTFLAERGLKMDVDALQLYYDDAPVLRAEGLSVLGADGNLAIYGEAAAIKLAKGRLFRLAVSPKIIEARGVTLRLVRTATGVVTIAGFPVGQGQAKAAQADGADTGVVEWLDALPKNNLWGRLKQVKVQGLTLLLRDDIQNAEWVLEEGKLALDRYEDSGERGSLLAQVRRLTGAHLNTPQGVRGLPIPVLVSLERTAGAEIVNVEAKFGQLNAAIIGDYMPPQLQDLIRGQGTLALGSILTRGNMLGLPWLTLRLRNASLNLPTSAGFSKPLSFPQLEATVAYAPSPTDTLTIKNLAVTGPRGNLFIISGTVLHTSTSPTLNLTGFSPGGQVQALFDFLPDADPKFAKTYQWLRNNLIDATYKNLVARAGLRLTAFPKCGEYCGPLQIDAEIMGGKIRYMSDLPVAEIIPGKRPATFHWRGQTLAVIAPTAKVAEQSAQSVWVELSQIFAVTPTLVQVSATLAGPIAPLVAHLNAIPEVGNKIPAGFTGQHQSVLNVKVPLAKDTTPTFAASTIEVQSQLVAPRATGLPVLGADTLSAPRGNLTLDAAKALRVVIPNASLLGGKVGFIWQQNLQPGQPAAMALQASGTLPGAWLQQVVGAQTLSATGGVTAVVQAAEDSKGGWSFTGKAEAAGAMLNLGPANFRKAAGQPLTVQAAGRYQTKPAVLTLTTMKAVGQGVDISGSLTLPLAQPEAGRANFTSLKLAATDVNLNLANRTLKLRGKALDLRGLSLAQKTARTPQALALDTQLKDIYFGPGVLANAKLQAKVVAARWQLQTVQGKIDDGSTLNISRRGNQLNINIPNLGRTLEVFGVYDKLKGGTLLGALTYTGPSSAKGELSLNHFELRNPPTMLKILGLLSLEQLVAGTDTTKFSSGKIPLGFNNESIILDNAQLRGPSMDLRLYGRYIRGTEELDFNGSMAPAIPFNRLVAKVPLLGTLLTGSQDGLVVADFRLNGKATDPQVSVKPLSILTPGLLKDLFRGGSQTYQNETPR